MDVHYGGEGISKLQFLIKKSKKLKDKFFSAVFFTSFGHQNPGSGSGFSWNVGSGSTTLGARLFPPSGMAGSFRQGSLSLLKRGEVRHKWIPVHFWKEDCSWNKYTYKLNMYGTIFTFCHNSLLLIVIVQRSRPSIPVGWMCKFYAGIECKPLYWN